VGTFTVTTGGDIFLDYSGDSNYPSWYGDAYINMPDFAIFPQGGFQVIAGQSQDLTITFQSSSGFSGTVTSLSCSGLPAETTCTFSPTSVTLPSDGSVNTTLTLSTTAMGQSRLRGGKILGSRWGGAQLLLIAACFIGLPIFRRKKQVGIVLSLLGLLLAVPSCGGGGGGGGGGQNNPVPSISSLTPSQIAAGSQIQSLYINGTNFMNSSTVTYNGVVHNSSLQSATQLQVALAPTDVAATGQYAVVVKNPSPGGGSSAPASFAVVTGTPTGLFTITLTATAGPITHNTTFQLSVQ